MSLHHLLDSIPKPPNILWNINTLKALEAELDLKFKAFISSDSTNILYSSYLLQYLEIFRSWSDELHPKQSRYMNTLDLAECRIIHYLQENDMLSINPLALYASYDIHITVDAMNQLREVNLSSEMPNCFLSVWWRWESSNFKAAYICDPVSVSLIAEYDTGLPARMSQAVTGIYHQIFLPSFQSCRRLMELIVIQRQNISLGAMLHLMQPCDNSNVYTIVEEGLADLHGCSYHPRSFWVLRAFQDQFFGGDDPENNSPGFNSVIDRSSWYPYLAAYLLNENVKCQYQQLHPQFYAPIGLPFFNTYLGDCLPYAYPTERNLTALRALRVLSSTNPTPWNPPLGFCSGINVLLLKYDRSSLSLEELARLTGWLGSLVEEGASDSEEDNNNGTNDSGEMDEDSDEDFNENSDANSDEDMNM
ncbi:hypothetical protein CVT25_002000 [Psilocybe cyanescens]|uniref:Uncharacterized protein n=1 Tax=Psilocybe cyanescens TaxID=93625 RepID=A0A409X5G2_PSICY|nr:hypothetical protein CVT25_002000 [Psilocybe cyanescens]